MWGEEEEAKQHKHTMSSSSSSSASCSNGLSSSSSKRPKPYFACGIDIGGTLCKICYFEPYPNEKTDTADVVTFRNKARKLIEDELTYGETGRRDEHLELESKDLGGRILFMRFETRKMDAFLEAIRESQLLLEHGDILCCTGGGARKYHTPMTTLLNVTLPRTDELECLVDGINFVLHHPASQLFQVNHEQRCVNMYACVCVAW